MGGEGERGITLFLLPPAPFLLSDSSLAKLPRVMPYAESLGSSATVSTGAEIQALVNF